MAKMVNMHEAKTHLSRLADQVRESGEPLIIAKAGTPWVQVCLVHAKKPVLGLRAKEYAEIDTNDWDQLDEEIAASFETSKDLETSR
jgi:antitoxin (DNA-binding transcriptional repressor) of toxin-antitoxin stability system